MRGSSPLARGLLMLRGGVHLPTRIIPARAGFTDLNPGVCRSPCGSSPLARGLLPLQQVETNHTGIIPARAGFTSPRWCWETGRTDHPRSRGVYPMLAVCSGHVPRIIPARAGFTRPGRDRRAGPKDHPRSRGVYFFRARLSPGQRGSSPLARGLPALSTAGYTANADHPRSRGVYQCWSHFAVSFTGSSPLARGLLNIDGTDLYDFGIIPARAGFTCTRGRTRCRSADHPRSRGVYDGYGLWGDWLMWIIPARAGFTRGETALARPGADHPRSRGVYEAQALIDTGRVGSSPLARGLQVLPGSGEDVVGIIPARAGFTTSTRPYATCGVGSSPLARGLPGVPGSASGVRGDHPRSRGVYRDDGVVVVQRPWIIPARAGFTGWLRGRRVASPDHPRSRGVYGPGIPGSGWVLGSSPLARGLRVQSLLAHDIAGIIPARAGFTVLFDGSFGVRADHPRSRGVYLALRLVIIMLSGSSPLARGLLNTEDTIAQDTRIIPARAGFTTS